MAEPATQTDTGTQEPVKTATTEPPTTEPTGWMGNTGEFRDGAPDNIQTLLGNKKWTNVEQMAEAYIELEKFKGVGNHLVIPEVEDAEGWDNVYNQLGRPETADKYTYEGERVEMLGEELMEQFREYAHKSGKTQSQFQSDIDFQLDAIEAMDEVIAQQAEDLRVKNEASLKQLYGINYDNAMQDADLTSQKHNYVEQIASEGLEGSPIVKILLNHISNLEAEDGINKGGQPPVEKSLQQQLEEIKADPAFLSKFDPKHKEVMAKYMDLNRKIANSGQAPMRRQA
jgi:hypothetical protein